MNKRNELFKKALDWIYSEGKVADQRELSSVTGINEVTISRIVNNKVKEPSEATLRKLDAAFGHIFNMSFFRIDYVTGQPVNNKKQTRTVNLPSSYIGTSGQLAVSIFGLSGADEWVTNVSVTATDADSKVLGSANISGAPFKANRSTEYSGNLFGSSGGLDVSINSE